MASEQNAHQLLGATGQRFAKLLHWAKARWRHKGRAKVKALAQWIPSGGTILDIGAHFGTFAKEFARLHGGTCKVYCFEPVSYNFSILASVTGGFSNIIIFRSGLADEAGEKNIHIPVKSSGKIGPGLAHLGAETRRDYIVEKITLTTLDAFLESSRPESVDFIKCDVEGAELLVFQGGKKLFERYSPTVFCEVSADYTARLGYEPHLLFRFFLDRGYEAYLVQAAGGRKRVAGYGEAGDYLFVAPGRQRP